jgi:glutamine amidotransferase
MTRLIGIVNYGAGNIFSVLRGLQEVGAYPQVVSDPDDLIRYDSIIVPGVGAFGECMANLRAKGLDQALQSFAESGKPLLGLCVGMQILLSSSTEHGRHLGLNLIRGEVVAIDSDPPCRVPHVGWSSLLKESNTDGTLLEFTDASDSFYFTHSYVAKPSNPSHVLAKFRYGEQSLIAAVGRDNIIGFQFHPELSSYSGLKLLRYFTHN